MAGRFPSLWLPGRFFLMGGSVPVAPNVRTLVASRILEPVAREITLHRLAACSQNFQGVMLWEILNGAQTLFNQSLNTNFTNEDLALPWLRTESPGRLDIFVTHALGGTTSISSHLEGIYGPRI